MACTAAVLAMGLVGAAAVAPAAATRGDDDERIAQAGTLVVSDLPAGFSAKLDTGTSTAENLRLARGVDGCAPYVSLQKITDPLPSARSESLEDATRQVSNEVDVFRTDRAAGAALSLYAKPSLVGCLEKLYEKRVRQDPKVSGSVDDVDVHLERQDIGGLGDESVVYEGSVDLTASDGSRTHVGIGNASVRVGRVIDSVSFSTTGGDLVEILTPAIDASVGRIRATYTATPS
jgi:hypothetical protein